MVLYVGDDPETPEIPKLPVVPLPGSERWERAYEWGEQLMKQFPGQQAEDFACACEYNSYGPAKALYITDFACEQYGENDGNDWIWRVEFEDGSVWRARGWCDFTGWDCRSDLQWTQMDSDPTKPPATFALSVLRKLLDADNGYFDPEAGHVDVRVEFTEDEVNYLKGLNATP